MCDFLELELCLYDLVSERISEELSVLLDDEEEEEEEVEW